MPSVLRILDTMIESGSLYLFLVGPIPGFVAISQTIGYEKIVFWVRLVCPMVIANEIAFFILYCTDLPRGYVAWAGGAQAVLQYIFFCGFYLMLDWNEVQIPEKRGSAL